MDVKEIKQNRIYDDLALYMPFLSQTKDCREEAVYWKTVLREKLGTGKHKILVLGAGGGLILSHFTNEFDVTAVDISETMLSLCKQLNPHVTIFQGDMRSIRLRENFSAVLIHNAINYMLTEQDLLNTFATAAAHLIKGGIFIINPDYYQETFNNPTVKHMTTINQDKKLTYFEYTYDPDPEDTTIESIITLIFETEGHLEIEHDRHMTGIFPKSTWLRLMNKAGFETELKTFYHETINKQYELLTGVWH